MKRAFGILFVFLFGVCLTGGALALTLLRPRKESLPPGTSQDSGFWLRRQVTWEWHFEREPGWYDCGPLFFLKGESSESWLVAVEKAAYSFLLKKPWANQATLSFQQLPDSWRVVARSPKGEIVAMDFREDGSSFARR